MPIGFAFRGRGLGQASPSLEAPRLQALDSFISILEREKVVITKTSKEKRLLLGSFLAPETDMIFGDGVGASPVPRPLLPTCWLFCVTLMRFYIGTAQLKKVLVWA